MKMGRSAWILVFFLLLLLLLILFSAFANLNSTIDTDTIMQIPTTQSIAEEIWSKLSEKKIFFAHMSVGYNILDGARQTIEQDHRIPLQIIETDNPNEMVEPGLYHFTLGYNTEPLKKIEFFETLIHKIGSAHPEIVLMKFCYIDIDSETDIEALFSVYHDMIERLTSEFPKMKFLHCTVPLKSSPLSPKTKLKEIIKPILGKATELKKNTKRNQLNQLIRTVWPQEEIYDIALLESGTPNGNRVYKLKKDQKIPFLFQPYTSDGGHLNEIGRLRLGEQFLIFLAKNVT